jgi:hypothetical protein
MAIRGSIQDGIQQDGEILLGSSGVQIRLKVDLVLEGFHTGRVV